MPYDNDFYKQYRAYLQEPIVRRNHDEMFALFAHVLAPDIPRVLDLGCATGEYSIYDRRHSEYVGVDINQSDVPNFIPADYARMQFLPLLPFAPNSFVSLFSAECCFSATERYELYEKIFGTMPSIRVGLVGGFFYRSRRNEEKVGEVGGILSYQTIEDPALHISTLFREFRLHIETPSKMFGQDVVEVWKILERR